MNFQISSNNMVIKKRDRIIYLRLDEILFIERFKTQTIVQTNDDGIVIFCPLKEILDNLPDNFLRTHRSYIINKDKIKEISSFNKNTYEVVFSNRKSALIIRKNLPALLK